MVWAGSPPHTRGKVGQNIVYLSHPGITPAYAGKSPSPMHYKQPVRDHPRIRGEKWIWYPGPSEILGSPPHTRGKVQTARGLKSKRGITPAYAGKRVSTATASSCPQDHPRICGEKSKGISFSSFGQGSPPHTRGKAVLSDLQRCTLGITPAYAGKRSPGCRPRQCPRDHPRIRGEKATATLRCRSWTGSPPHTRGKGSRFGSILSPSGITPAYAGKRPSDGS